MSNLRIDKIHDEEAAEVLNSVIYCFHGTKINLKKNADSITDSVLLHHINLKICI